MISRSPIADPFGLVGTLVERKYRVDKAVAEGGFGIVYAGHHITLDRPIALKVMRPDARAGLDAEQWADILAQFLQEAKTIARLRHPAIVSVLDVGVLHNDAAPSGLPWMVMEWLEGETLRDELAQRRAAGADGRSVADTMRLARPILEAIAEAHEAGIVHRDLKPSNVMMVPHKRGPRARVVDFGIAKVMDRGDERASGDTTTAGVMKAFSAAAAAPEQISGTRTGPWTDVHALGLLLTEVLTDQSPYPLEDANDHFKAVFDEKRPTPGKLGVDVGGWEPVLAKALALKPADRYANAGELLGALEDALSPEARAGTVEQVTTEPRASAVPPTRRGRTSGLRSMIAASVVVALGAVAFTWLSRKPTDAGRGNADADVMHVSCTSHTTCTAQNGGRASICRPQGCVELASEDCHVYADARALESDRTVWLGAMFPLSGEDATAFGNADLNAVDLGRRDFAQITSGLTEGSDRARPFGVIGCDDAVDPRRAAKHLAEDVGVAAVIGFRASLEAIDLATSLFVPKRVLTIAALNTNPLVTTVPQPVGEPRLVWRTTYNSADTAGALSALVEGVLEPQLHVSPLRVAVVRQKNAAGAAFSEALFKTLRFNGKSALDNGYDFHEVTFEPGGPDEAHDAEDIATDLLHAKPHTVIMSGGASLLVKVASHVEARWPASERVRPRYANAALLTPEMLAFIGDSADRRHRFFGMTTVSTIATNARFVMHYNEVFPDKITRTISPNTAYDAFYMLAYATYALDPSEPATGPALARRFARLVPPGVPIDVGIAGIFDAFAALRAGKNVDLAGSTGSMDFDLTTGEAPLDHAVVCAAIDEHGRAFDGVESGLVWSAKTRKLDGALRCP